VHRSRHPEGGIHRASDKHVSHVTEGRCDAKKKRLIRHAPLVLAAKQHVFHELSMRNNTKTERKI
jgi:hypothetical protein